MSPTTRPDPLADDSARDFRNPGARARALEAAARVRFAEQLAAERRAAELDTPAPELAALHVEKLHHDADRLLAMLDGARPIVAQYEAGAVVDAPEPVVRRGLFDQIGTRDDTPPDLVTVYAVALIFQPREPGAADPIVILRQIVRTGRRPLTTKEVITHATELEVNGWKSSRAPLELFGVPTGIVTYQIVPASA